MNRIVLFSSEARRKQIEDFLRQYFPEIKISFYLPRNIINLLVIMKYKNKGDIVLEAGRINETIGRFCRFIGKPYFQGVKEYCIKKAGVSTEDYERCWTAFFHEGSMDSYYCIAETDEFMDRFWGDKSPFVKMFSKLDQTSIIELACGRGRHVQKYIDSAQSITLVDVLEKNIEICKERFKGNTKIHFYKNNGRDLAQLPDCSFTSLFTYDAMVHFHYLDVNNYLKETYRVLKPGSYALFHHSNNDKDYKAGFMTGSIGRAFMSKNLFAHMAYEAGFEIVEQHVLDWEKYKKIDCATLLRKPKETI